ncbi:SbcC/MukB-like Walker B domain-containing protein, partial [[Actinomadura] parvosata]|uniref:SbcC/MukB-like Walker B domain-containing protein n=1 Tax=[Actinomadura] parvosata TaxID=1955412 RepID=UPI001647BB7A
RRQSTLIDAICFALYGTVPRWGKENVIAHALAPSAVAAKVALVFETAGRRYAVVRALKRDAKGKVHTAEARLEELLTSVPATAGLDELMSAVARPLAEGAAVTAEIQRITGLEYKFFTQCVVLPQGRFAEFLHAQPRERQDLLVQLLDADVYERVRQRAVQEESAATQAAAFARERLARLTDADEPAQQAAKARLSSLRALDDQVRGSLDTLRNAAGEIRRLAAERETARERVAALAALALPPEVPTLAETVRAAASQVREHAADAERAEAEERRAEDTLAALDDPGLLMSLLSTLDDHERAAADLRAVEERAARARAGLPPLAERARAAEAALAEAEQARDRLRDAHAGADLGRRLVVGQDCPTCLRPVERLPHHPATADLRAAERHVKTCRAEADQARARRTEAETELRHLERTAEDLAERVTRTAHDLAAQATPLVTGTSTSATPPVPDEQPAPAAPEPDEQPAPAAPATPPAPATPATPATPPAPAGPPAPATQPTPASGGAAASTGPAAPAEAAGPDAFADAGRRVGAAFADDDASGRDVPSPGVERDDLEGRLAGVRAAERRAAELRQAARDARARLAAATRRAEELAGKADRLWRDLEAARDTVVPLGAPPLDRDDLHDAWTSLLAWRDEAAVRERAALEERAGRVAEAERQARAQWSEVVARLADHGVPIPETTAHPAGPAHGGTAAPRGRSGEGATGLSSEGVPGLSSEGASGLGEAVSGGAPDEAAVARLGEAVVAAVAQAQAYLARVRENRAAAREVDERARAEEERARVAKELAQCLRADAFERWLCTEALDLLVTAASETLRELSDGQYELALGARNEIEVIDHAEAGLRRNARTLSGGETFQAALALALALSDQVAGLSATAARSLDSLFLDEGFGSLDPATLDTVATTLERLAGGRERMVGVVTHVPALADRIPVRFEVRRDAKGSHLHRATA